MGIPILVRQNLYIESSPGNIYLWFIVCTTTFYQLHNSFLIDQLLSSLPPSAAYMRQWPGSALVQVMACRLSLELMPLTHGFFCHCQHTNPSSFAMIRQFSRKRLVPQMRAPLAACREPAGKLWLLCRVLYVFEHKTQYLLIHAPFTCIVVFWYFSNMPP